MSRRALRILLCIPMLLAAAGTAHGQANEPFGWTISSSPTDPFANSGSPVGGPATHYLWLSCSGLPITHAQFDLVSSDPSNVLLAFTPMNGFLNAGTATSLQLAVGGCPSGPVLVGSITSLQAVPGSYCLAPSTISGTAFAGACGMSVEWSIEWIGFDFGGGACQSLWSSCVHGDCLPPVNCLCCLPDGACIPGNWGCPSGSTVADSCVECNPVSVDPESWGTTKAGYR